MTHLPRTLTKARSALALVSIALASSACGSSSKSPAPGTGGEPGSSVGSAGTSTSSGGGSGSSSLGMAGSTGSVNVTPDAAKDCGTPAHPSVPNLKLTLFAQGFTRPIFMTQPRGETERSFVVEKDGHVLITRGATVAPTPFLDVSASVTERYEELGLLGMAFHPNYAENGKFYIYYSTLKGSTAYNRVVEYTVSSDNPDIADPNSARILFEIQKPQDNHNGGDLIFGPDGYLYVGTGDGGGAGDDDSGHGTQGNGQNLGAWLGKMLRIDVDGTGAGPNSAYAIPPGNLQQDGALPEIWSYGLRNPWRYSFDACTGDMYIGDVGQDKIEEIDFEPAGAAGRNYGWRLMEANSCFNPGNGCDATDENLTLPVAQYTHSVGQSVTGGYVYRGHSIPDLRGTYLYVDYETNRFFALRMSGGQVALSQTDITDNINGDGEVSGIGSFAQNDAGDVFVLEFNGGRIFRVDAR
jgi:glucose/arabinose dehydrogenase